MKYILNDSGFREHNHGLDRSTRVKARTNQARRRSWQGLLRGNNTEKGTKLDMRKTKNSPLGKKLITSIYDYIPSRMVWELVVFLILKQN